MLNQIGRPQYANAFARILGVDDQAAVATLAPEVMPCLSLFERPEFFALMGGRICCGKIASAAPGAGSMHCAQIESIGGGSLLIVVDKIYLNNASEYSLGISIPRQAGYVDTNEFHMDARMAPPGGIGAGIGARLSMASVVGGTGAINLVLVGPGEFNLDFIINPGNSLHIQGGDNQATNYSLRWRERMALDDELERL